MRHINAIMVNSLISRGVAIGKCALCCLQSKQMLFMPPMPWLCARLLGYLRLSGYTCIKGEKSPGAVSGQNLRVPVLHTLWTDLPTLELTT